MEIAAIELKQNEQLLYVFVAEVGFIREKFEVSIREHDKDKGYQRNFSQKRFNDLKNYILKGGFMPNSILVNLNKEICKYNEIEKMLIFDDVEVFGLIIDGQHRVGGTHLASPNFNLIVVATLGLPVEDQAKLFITINKTQKGVPSSLYLDLFDLTEGQIEDFDDENVPWRRRAIEIAKRLNEEEDSPLYDLIRMQGQTGLGISLSQFVSNIKEHVDHEGNFFSFTFEEQYNIFKIYFKAIKSVFLDEWENPNSMILKTTGFGGLLYSMYEVFNLVRIKYNDRFNTENTIEVLNKINDFKFNSKTFGAGSSAAAQKRASQIFINRLKENVRENQNGLIIEE